MVATSSVDDGFSRFSDLVSILREVSNKLGYNIFNSKNIYLSKIDNILLSILINNDVKNPEEAHMNLSGYYININNIYRALKQNNYPSVYSELTGLGILGLISNNMVDESSMVREYKVTEYTVDRTGEVTATYIIQENDVKIKEYISGVLLMATSSDAKIKNQEIKIKYNNEKRLSIQIKINSNKNTIITGIVIASSKDRNLIGVLVPTEFHPEEGGLDTIFLTPLFGKEEKIKPYNKGNIEVTYRKITKEVRAWQGPIMPVLHLNSGKDKILAGIITDPLKDIYSLSTVSLDRLSRSSSSTTLLFTEKRILFYLLALQREGATPCHGDIVGITLEGPILLVRGDKCPSKGEIFNKIRSIFEPVYGDSACKASSSVVSDKNIISLFNDIIRKTNYMFPKNWLSKH